MIISNLIKLLVSLKDTKSSTFDSPLKIKFKTIKKRLGLKVVKSVPYFYYSRFLKVYLPFSSISKLIWNIIMLSNFSNGGSLFFIN